jgi:hypothetical protein
MNPIHTLSRQPLYCKLQQRFTTPPPLSTWKGSEQRCQLLLSKKNLQQTDDTKVFRLYSNDHYSLDIKEASTTPNERRKQDLRHSMFCPVSTRDPQHRKSHV